MVESTLKDWTAHLANGVEVVAAIIIGLATIEAVVTLAVVYLRRRQTSGTPEGVRLRLGRWLALALEFELAADIIRTAVAPDWQQIGQLAAIATIRTLLNYFLQQEIDRAAKPQEANPAANGAVNGKPAEVTHGAE